MANPPIPDGANSAEILQQTVRKIYNKHVKDWFQDVDVADELDLSIARHAAYAACRHDDDDSLVQTVSRQLLFTELRDRLTVEEIGETSVTYENIKAGCPQVFLYFREDLTDVEPGYRAVHAKLSFRLVNENINVSKAALTVYAQRIKNQFNTDAEQIWRKGRLMCSYSEPSKGYLLKLLSRDKNDAKSMVNKLLAIQNYSPDWELFKTNETDDETGAYPTIPPNEVILGETRRLPRRRPIATVRFQWAIARMGATGITQALVDRTGKYSDPLVDW